MIGNIIFKVLATVLFAGLCLPEKGVTMSNYDYKAQLSKNIEDHTSFLDEILNDTLNTTEFSEPRSVLYGTSTAPLNNIENRIAELLERIKDRITKGDYNCNNDRAKNINSSVEKILQFYTEIHPVNLQILYPDLMKIITIING